MGEIKNITDELVFFSKSTEPVDAEVLENNFSEDFDLNLNDKKSSSKNNLIDRDKKENTEFLNYSFFNSFQNNQVIEEELINIDLGNIFFEKNDYEKLDPQSEEASISLLDKDTLIDNKNNHDHSLGFSTFVHSDQSIIVDRSYNTNLGDNHSVNETQEKKKENLFSKNNEKINFEEDQKSSGLKKQNDKEIQNSNDNQDTGFYLRDNNQSKKNISSFNKSDIFNNLEKKIITQDQQKSTIEDSYIRNDSNIDSFLEEKANSTSDEKESKKVFLSALKNNHQESNRSDILKESFDSLPNNSEVNTIPIALRNNTVWPLKDIQSNNIGITNAKQLSSMNDNIEILELKNTEIHKSIDKEGNPNQALHQKENSFFNKKVLDAIDRELESYFGENTLEHNSDDFKLNNDHNKITLGSPLNNEIQSLERGFQQDSTFYTKSHADVILIIAHYIEKIKEEGKSWTRLSLSLGEGKKVDLHIKMHDGKVGVKLQNAPQDIQDTLSRGWGQLMHLASRKGIQLEEINFSSASFDFGFKKKTWTSYQIQKNNFNSIA